MSTTFVGRVRELALLERAYRSDEHEFIPIYGRRRIGKSELILHFIRGKRAIYHLGKKAPAPLQVREFLAEAARALDAPLLARVACAGWADAIRTVLEHARAGEKVILAFDEFQWTAEASPDVPSILQELCDRKGRAGARVFLILCGSYMGFMEKEVLGRESPLFGRRTAQILLPPFSYREAAEFHPRLGAVDRALVYFICGGIPYYLRFFSQDDSVAVHIRKNLLDEYAALFREPEFLLREELKEVEKYHGIMMALAAGSATAVKIAAQTGIAERNLYYYLQNLVALGYVSRRHPLTSRPPVAKHVRFVVDDPLLRFWFRFVYPNLSFLSQAGPERTLRELIAPQLDAYFGACFERLCREALPALYAREGIDAAFEVGEYWDADLQLDVVGIRKDNRIDIGECKWGAIRSAAALERELAAKLQRYPNPANATLQARIFCRRLPGRATALSSDVRWHTLQDLYDGPKRGG